MTEAKAVIQQMDEALQPLTSTPILEHLLYGKRNWELEESKVSLSFWRGIRNGCAIGALLWIPIGRALGWW